jgi:deoxyribodipyrimidine photo-lyase
VSKPLTILWLRNNLRLADHPALANAAAHGAVLPVFIWAPQEDGDWPPGAASRWWLHQSLQQFSKQLERLGSRLILRRGDSLAELLDLCRRSGAQRVVWQRCYEPAAIARDTIVKAALRQAGIEALSFDGALLREPWDSRTGGGTPFQIFTPFWRALLKELPEPEPTAPPKKLVSPEHWPQSLTLEALELMPRIHWYEGIQTAWAPGEAGAQKNLKNFLAGAVDRYSDGRDRPALAATSRLSPHLHFGEITPRQIWRALRSRVEAAGGTANAWRQHKFLSEVIWREFAHHLLFHFPHTPYAPLRSDFTRFPWVSGAAAQRSLSAWQRGQTGIKLVDAGLRELWHTGYMHNRVRMVAASFLVKNLRVHWHEGARWFWDTLVDADLANNTLGWQWVAGCGADAAPYFRIFNPNTQAEKFDPENTYIERWVPEHAKAEYAKPIVDLGESRNAALSAYQQMRAKI